jgi:crossover junction endodeoxyribonuclease RuvC
LRIIGIDPGSHRVGYSILEKNFKSKVEVLDYGTIQVTPKTPIPESLVIINKELNLILKKWKPEIASVEELFYFKNQKTVSAVYQSRGVILLTIQNHHIPILEPTVTQIKKGITGSGNADKSQIKKAVQMILGIEITNKYDDSWDAIACGFVGLSMIR